MAHHDSKSWAWCCIVTHAYESGHLRQCCNRLMSMPNVQLCLCTCIPASMLYICRKSRICYKWQLQYITLKLPLCGSKSLTFSPMSVTEQSATHSVYPQSEATHIIRETLFTDILPSLESTMVNKTVYKMRLLHSTQLPLKAKKSTYH